MNKTEGARGPYFIILGVDELMDMARTTVSLVGNCLASAVMARRDFHPLSSGVRPLESLAH